MATGEVRGAEGGTDEGAESDAGGQQRFTVLERHGYSLERVLGTGTYALVRLARSERHQGDVAVKIISKFQAPSDFLARFLPREIEVVRELRHPNVIRYLQSIETTHRVYIVMEYAENGTLLDLVRKESFVEESPRAKRWFSQLTDGVGYCHDHGVVHRDIKCENLLMDGGFNLKLSDFGFARGLGSGGVLSETFCGSYAYASPEILQATPYDPHLADVWAMGVVLFAMLFGRLPFDDSNFNRLVRQATSRIRFPRDPVVSEQAKLLIMRLIAPLRNRLSLPLIAGEPWMEREDAPLLLTS